MATLVEHTDAHLEQDEERKFKCDECGRGYRHAGSLANHKKAHDVGLFECHLCGKENSNALALKSHMRSHTAHKKYSCSRCGKAFRLATQLATHERAHRVSQSKTEDEEYEDMANNHWNNQSIHAENGLVDHNQPQCDSSDDADGRPFKCDLCDKTYIHLRSLSNHKKTHQVGIFECTVCFKLFNNMAALYSHQRTHKIRSGRGGGSSSASGFCANSTQEQFSPKSPDGPVNFCHLCQVVFPSEEEFQEHIQMHNSSSATFGLEDNTAESHHMTYNNITSPQSSFYAAPNDLAPLPSVDNCQGFDPPRGHMYSNSNQTPSSDCSQGQPPLVDPGIHNPLPNASGKDDASAADSDERPFRKKYPHLAALKSHLRLHKGHKSSFNPNGAGDWLASEQFSPVSDQGLFFSTQDAEDNDDPHLGLGTYLDRQDSAPDASVRPPHAELSTQRHMCADCGDSFADIAGIMAHSCPLLQQQHPSGDHNADGNFEDTVAQFQGLNETPRQSYFEQSFKENLSGEQLSGIAEEDDGDLFQCSICGNSYSSMQALRSHLRGHTQSRCAAASSGPSSLSSQEEARDEEPEEMMICSSCGESFASRQDLLAHQLEHVKHRDEDGVGASEGQACEEETQSVICGRCGTFCADDHHLESHNCAAEKKEEESAAAESGEEVEVKAKNLQHQARHHVRDQLEDRQHRCDQCGRSYRHSGSLLNHKKSHKTGVFKCSVCQKRFYNLLALKNHQRSHFDIKRHTCDECGKAFKIQKQLLIHLRRHKENRAKIKELNKQIQALMQMNNSEAEAAREAPERTTQAANAAVTSERTGDRRPFACEQCGRTYRHAGSLVNHKKSHKTGHYYCSICNKAYTNQLAVKNHLRTHFASRKHSCQKCGKGFRGKWQLVAHICGDSRKGGGRSSRSRAPKCIRCKETFQSRDQLAAHACDRSPASHDEERAFSCNICHRSYRHAGSLLNHKNTHKTGHFSCTFCAKPFSNPMALRNHTRIHTQQKKYACLTCGKAFRLASILHNHQKVHNRANARFSCPACGKSFRGRSGLKRHRCQRGRGEDGTQPEESQDKCFRCDLCGRSYRHAGSLLNHKKTHSENLHHCGLCLQTFPDPLALQMHSQMRRHCCPECGKTFCLITHLQSHMEVHSKDRSNVGSSGELEANGLSWTEPLSRSPENAGDQAGKSHVCEHCGRTYRHAGSLLNHKNSHKTGSFTCSACHKEFSNLMALKNHRRIHTEPKRYQCLECGKAFRVSTQLICHRRIHSKEKPFSCALCARSFSNKSNLRHHEKLHQNHHAYDDTSTFNLDANGFMGLDMGSFL
ncbi:zinc finger protein 646 isoform X2 [Syngnathus scovelli]|uniref:zinc finger protein 646 isoform X2 n=1 Tax=Syngnathus scovelli TaxID=161590 RepID=UPI00210FF6CC|nr:zinc finger protein 62 homolog isoform X2 [Syngnathus scovelli]